MARPWTPAEDAVLIAAVAAAASNDAIADQVGRSPEAVQARLKILRRRGVAVVMGDRRLASKAAAKPVAPVPGGAPTPSQPALRRCLGADCGRMFTSTHAGNRLCPRCKAGARADEGLFGVAHVVRYR